MISKASPRQGFHASSLRYRIAFQGVAGGSLPHSAWQAAVEAAGDKQLDLVRTSLTLRYAPDTDELFGEYWDLKIVHDAGKYQRTEPKSYEFWAWTELFEREAALRFYAQADADPGKSVLGRDSKSGRNFSNYSTNTTGQAKTSAPFQTIMSHKFPPGPVVV